MMHWKNQCFPFTLAFFHIKNLSMDKIKRKWKKHKITIHKHYGNLLPLQLLMESQ